MGAFVDSLRPVVMHAEYNLQKRHSVAGQTEELLRYTEHERDTARRAYPR